MGRGKRSFREAACGISIVLLLAAAMVFTQVPVTNSATNWTAPLNVSPGAGVTVNRDPRMALDADGRPHVVWTGSDGAQDRVYYSGYTGSAWTVPQNLSPSSTGNDGTQVAVDPNGNLRVVWSGNDGVTDYIWYAENNGSGWSAQVKIYAGTSLSDNTDPQLALDDVGRPHVVWRGYDGARYRVFYSVNTGSAWSLPRNVSTSPSIVDNRDPRIVLDYGYNPHIVWNGNDGANWQIYYSQWATPLLVSSGASTSNRDPEVAIDSGNLVHVAWTGYDGATDRVYYSADTGSGWSAPRNLSTTSTGNGDPSLALDSAGNPRAAWTGSGLIYYSADNGSGWSAPLNLSTTSTGNGDPSLALDSANRPFVAWSGNSGGADRFLYTEHDGSGWYAPEILSDTLTGNFDPLLMVDEGRNPHAVWAGSDGATDRIWYSVDIRSYRITAEVLSGEGEVDPASQWIYRGEPATIDITQDPCYRITSLTDNGVPQAIADPYVITDVQQAHSVRVVLVENVFYFAEGYTGPGFEEYLCLGNPSNTPLQAQVTFLFKDGTSWMMYYDVPALSRFTLLVNQNVGAGKEVSIKCGATVPFVAERPMYFNYTTGGVNWTGGTDAVGATRTSNTWYFAEGYTGPGFDEWVCVLNPGNTEANLTFNFQTQEEGPVVKAGYTVGPHTRGTFKVNDVLGFDYQSSLKLESDVPVVAERPMYFDYLGPSGDLHWTGGHTVTGLPALARDYYFAEGTTRSAFQEWLTLQNPWDYDITVYAVYQFNEGAPIQREYPIPPGYRFTAFVPGEVGMERDVSVYLFSSSEFLAERPMYFDYSGTERWGWTGGHCVIGSVTQGTDWFLAEGYTGSGFEEWLCVQNTGGVEAHLTITYYPEGGAAPINTSHTVPPASRYTILVNEDAGENIALSTWVSSDQPVIVERPMYFDYKGWTGGHDVVGYQP